MNNHRVIAAGAVNFPDAVPKMFQTPSCSGRCCVDIEPVAFGISHRYLHSTLCSLRRRAAGAFGCSTVSNRGKLESEWVLLILESTQEQVNGGGVGGVGRYGARSLSQETLTSRSKGIRVGTSYL